MFEIIEYQDKYRQDVVRLLGAFWKINQEMAEALFQWKYVDCPFSDAVNIVLLKKQQRIVGMRGAYILQLQYGQQVVKSGLLGDTLIEEAYRGQGQLSPLTDYLLSLLTRNGISMALNTSATAPVWKHSIKHGWKSTEPFTAWQKHDQEKIKTASGFAVSDKAIGYVQPGESGNLIYSNQIYSQQMAALCQKTAAKDKAEIKKDETYFNWRYFKPTNQYRFIYLFAKETNAAEASDSQTISTANLKGFLVLSASPLSLGSQGSLADWGFSDVKSLRTLVLLFLQINPFYQVDCIAEPGSELMEMLQQEWPQKNHRSEKFPARILSKQPGKENQAVPEQIADRLDSLDIWRHSPINLDAI